MHPSLKLSNLSKLPLSTRKLAYAAASSQRTFDDVWDLFQSMSHVPDKFQPFVLPAFYATLDPTIIPTILAELDAPSTLEDLESLSLRIRQIALSLRAITTMASIRTIPPSALGDLWPRIWQFIEFLETYRDHLPHPLAPFVSASTYIQLLTPFARNEQTVGLLETTVGVYVVIGRAWAQLISEPDDEGFDGLCRFMGLWVLNDDWPHRVLEELIVGAGGSGTDLASLLVSHLDRVVPNPECEVTPPSVIYLAGVLFLVEKVMAQEWDEAFKEILLSQGIITALTTAAGALSLSNIPVARIELKGFFSALSSGMMCFPAHTRVAEAVRAGLLPAVISCLSRNDNPDGLNELLTDVLQEYLPSFTVYRSVLCTLRLALSGLRVAGEQIKDPVIVEYWQRFVAMAEHRIAVMDAHDAGSLTAPRMCGNLACGKLDDNHDFKRCSDCRSRYYCSPECQVSDWRCGGHRQTCDTLYSRRCDTMYINAEDRAFMRVLLNHDYAEKQHEIALDELEWMHDHPSETPYMFFDYDEGKLELYFESPEDAPEEFAQELSDSITSRSGRRLHLMSVYAGDEVDPEVWILPLAAERTGLARGLRLLADSIPPDTDWKEIKPAYASKVQDLLNGGVPESRAR